MPWRPPIAFCSTVGQAIFQTAGASGPSTIDRSKRRSGRAAAAAGAAAPGTPTGSSGADSAETSCVKTSLDFPFECALDVGMGKDDGRLALQRFEIAPLEPFAVLGGRQQPIDLLG